MNCLQIFYQDNLQRRYSTTKKGDDEMCPICEESKVSILLDCYV